MKAVIKSKRIKNMLRHINHNILIPVANGRILNLTSLPIVSLLVFLLSNYQPLRGSKDK